MYKKFFSATLVALLIFSLNNLSAFAVTPDDCCKVHNDSGAPGTCSVCGTKCIKITGNLGDNIYKVAGDVQCTQTNQCEADCPECECKPRE